ncbi:mitochondrial acidic protein mam33-like [Chenopodium quinoa]|uniref:mitochondrial acidic protein mam33-like n=1 Tax=Chenopodium quinoa TaxID=63459 RepID=UPI000B78856D|nr:mitochondrial acidic protein mam33-like [Chenopodium quinoa]
MFRKAIAAGAGVHQPWRMISRRHSSVVSSAVNSILLRSLKDHYLEVSKMAPPPKVNPPADFTIMKGALDSNGPVLKRNYKNEEISISVMRLANFVTEEDENDDDDGGINQLFVHVDVSKPGMSDSMHFLCWMYPDAVGIHSVALRPKTTDEGFLMIPNKYTGPLFENLDEATRDAFHNYIEERGINESLFPFLQAWLYVKDHRNLMRWFRSVGLFVNGRETDKGTDEAAANASKSNAAKGA